MSPLEDAMAFDAPLLMDTTTNAEAGGLARETKEERVKYSVFARSDSCNTPSRLILAHEKRVEQPLCGDIYN